MIVAQNLNNPTALAAKLACPNDEMASALASRPPSQSVAHDPPSHPISSLIVSSTCGPGKSLRQENRCVVIANGAVSDTFSPFVLLPPTFRFALDFPEALGDLAQALAPQSLDCPPQKSRYPSTPLFLESALSIMALSIPAGQDPQPVPPTKPLSCRPDALPLALRLFRFVGDALRMVGQERIGRIDGNAQPA